MKKNIGHFLFIPIIITILAVTACVRDTFRYNGYEDQLGGYFPVDSIENGHPWTLTSTGTSFVSGNVEGASKVQILSGDPFSDPDVEILAEATTSSRMISLQLYYVAPQILTQIYAAALDKNGNYLRLAAASVNQKTIDLGDTQPIGTPNSTRLQRIYYCFEADYPNPGDWDYNDLVLSATKEVNPDNPNVVELHVSLHAVGFLKQIAAAIRLIGYQYENVTITQDSVNFVHEPHRERLFIKERDVQLKARNGDAVINLFDDAHLAIYYSSSVDGSIYRLCFNTSNNGVSQQYVTTTYYIDFGDEYSARKFTLAEIDPFIVVRYGEVGDNFWEVHTYPYKLQEVLFGYYNGAAATYNNGFSWALAIPYGKFRYPIEEQPMGMRKKTIITGAYQTDGHSFGEWILNHNKAQDWYLYPADGGVYENSLVYPY